MPSFALLKASNSYLVKKLNILNINNKIIKNTFKNTFFFTNFLRPLPKE